MDGYLNIIMLEGTDIRALPLSVSQMLRLARAGAPVAFV